MSGSAMPPDDERGDGHPLRETVAENQRVVGALNAKLARKDHEIRIIQQISTEINATIELDRILTLILASFDRVLGFHHSMILMADQGGETLTLAASSGYSESGVGANVRFGEGTVSVVAKRRRMVRFGNLGAQLGYMSAVRSAMAAAGN
ncbi:MAG: adenylate cyclase, partial [Alphaproteobacteria bacterium]|nr:adenylate cyclase [Alphaproteobacteria bacterium]